MKLGGTVKNPYEALGNSEALKKLRRTLKSSAVWYVGRTSVTGR